MSFYLQNNQNNHPNNHSDIHSSSLYLSSNQYSKLLDERPIAIASSLPSYAYWTLDILNPSNWTDVSKQDYWRTTNVSGVELELPFNLTVDNRTLDNLTGSQFTETWVNRTWVSDDEGSEPQGKSQENGVNGMLVIAGLTFYLLAIFTAVGNALVLHAIRTEKRLQTVSNLFIMSLAAADLTVGLIVMPISAGYFVAGEWRWGVAVCQIWLAVDYTASTASIFNLVILSLDRYWSVSNPLRYLRKRTRKRALVMIGGSWAAAALWLVPLLAWHHIFYEGRRQHPSHVCETEFSDSKTFKIITSALNFYGPSALMVLLYFRIFRTIKTRASDTLGRVTPLESSAVHGPSTPNVQHKESFRNLTLVAYPKTNTDQDVSTSFYKGINVQVEYVDPPSSSRDSTKSSSRRPSQRDHAYMAESNGPMKNQLLTPKRYSPDNNRLSLVRNNCHNSHSSHHHKNYHQHHLACYPGTGTPPNIWATGDQPSTASVGSENDRWASFRNYRRGFAGLRGFLTERRGVAMASGNSTISNNERKNGALNIVKEKKAARQLGVIMGGFFACWFPYFTLFPIIAFCTDCIPARLHLATIWLGYLNSTLNPMIYPLCNLHFRRAFARMLHCRRRTSRHVPKVAFIPITY